MTMADRRRDASDNSSLEHIDPRCANIQKKSTTTHEHRHDTDKKYDGRNSSGPLTTDSQIDDSSTCIPTAATATPPHPYLDSVDPDQTGDLRGSVSPVQLPHSSTYFVAVTTDTIYKTPRAHTELSMSTSHLRQLPLFNSPTSPGRAIQGETPIKPQPLLESYDTNQVQSYCESNNEDEDYIKLHTRGIYSAPQIRSSDQSFDVRNQHNVQSLYLKRDVDTDAGEKTFDTLKKWREFSEIQLRQNQDNDESFLGACGGSDSECCALSAHAYEICDGEYQSLHLSSCESDRLSSGKTTATENDIKDDFRNENSLCMRVEDSLTCSQGFQPGYFDTDAKDSDSSSVFAADTDDIDDHEDTGTSYITQVSHDLSISQERESPDTVASPRRRRVGVIRPHEFPREICQSTSSFGVSVSTQTPHVTSIMIQQIMDMPVPLPNEARGESLAFLHCLCFMFSVFLQCAFFFFSLLL